MDGTPTLLKETFVVAFLDHADLSQSGWTNEERAVIQELRWWPVDALAARGEVIFPAALRALIAPIAHGDYPLALQPIDL